MAQMQDPDSSQIIPIPVARVNDSNLIQQLSDETFKLRQIIDFVGGHRSDQEVAHDGLLLRSDTQAFDKALVTFLKEYRDKNPKSQWKFYGFCESSSRLPFGWRS